MKDERRLNVGEEQLAVTYVNWSAVKLLFFNDEFIRLKPEISSHVSLSAIFAISRK